MNTEQVERELREKLEGFSYPRALREVGDGLGGPKRLQPHHVRHLSGHLLPWIMEIVGHARSMERIECGELP